MTTWFDRFLPTIDLTIPEAAEAMTDSALHMLIEYNLDGFRHDATKHIPTSYWQTLTQKIKNSLPKKSIYQIGETFGSRELIGVISQTINWTDSLISIYISIQDSYLLTIALAFPNYIIH